MKILVTGGAGYIGSVLVPMLLEESHGVTVIDNFLFNQTSLTDVIWKKNLTVLRGDVRDLELLKTEIAKHDMIIPLACLVGAPLCEKDPYAAREVNLETIKHICEFKSRSQQLIYPCTNSGYGIGQKDIYCDETSDLKPVSYYGRLKVDAEQYVLDNTNGTTFRFATLFGISPKMRLDLLVNDFVHRAITDRAIILFEAHFKRNYLHVRDAARAFIHVINNYAKMTGQAYNVGLSDANLSKEELCQVIQKSVPNFTYIKSDIGKDQDQRNYIVSNDKIEKTGYLPRISLQEGIKELIKGYQIIQRTEFRNA